MPTTALGRRLERVTAEQHRRQNVTRRRADLARFTDDEIEELSELAQKVERANAAGQSVAWTAEKMLVLDRLGTKHAAERPWSGGWDHACGRSKQPNEHGWPRSWVDCRCC
jgi:3',5'-cyclic AMP phosphodiesterase CpdA